MHISYHITHWKGASYVFIYSSFLSVKNQKHKILNKDSYGHLQGISIYLQGDLYITDVYRSAANLVNPVSINPVIQENYLGALPLTILKTFNSKHKYIQF